MLCSTIVLLFCILIQSCNTAIPSYLHQNKYIKNEQRAREDYLLPKNLIPSYYEMNIIPYLQFTTEKLYTFDAQIFITFRVNDFATNEIRIHAHEELEIDRNSITVRLRSFPSFAPVFNITRSNDDKHFLTIFLVNNMTLGSEYILFMRYTGKLNDDLKGFYKSSYIENNVKRWMAVTKLEPYSARRVFPCFDEPNMKAIFKINIAREPGYNVQSNMPIVSQNDPVAELPGWTWVKFQQSEVMSTYLVAFSVNQFDSISFQGVRKLKLWARTNAVQQGQYALSIVSPKVMDFMEEYTQHNYTLPKMDHLAIPDFASGAMENWGMITYRETYLLFENDVSTSRDKQQITAVVAHELAHQWFGNLVSPEWWDNIWLNEGFASYFEYYAAAEVEPEWQMQDQFVIDMMHTVLQRDALTTTHAIIVDVDSPDSMDSMFDSIAYNKGGCMVRMLASLMGENNFKAAIKNYFDTRSFKTANANNLWQSLQLQVPPGALPSRTGIKQIMDTWTLQPGYPVITATRDYNLQRINITQKRFVTSLTNDSYKEVWMVPLTMASQTVPNFNDLEVKFWLTRSGQVTLNEGLPSNDRWIILNNKQAGYYRVNYDVQNWELIIESLNKKTEMSKIHRINRAQIMDDALALARAKLLRYETAVDTTSYLHHETEYIPWTAGLSALGYLSDRLYEDEPRELFEWYLLKKIDEIYKTLKGFTININDSHITRLTRTLILTWACDQGHVACNSNAVDLFQAWQDQVDPDFINPIDPDLKSVVYCTGMQKGDKSVYNFLFDRYEAALNVASEQALIINGLGCASDKNLLESFLEESITPGSSIRSQDASRVVTAVYNNRLGVDLALDFLLENFEALPQLYGGYGRVNRVFSGISQKLNTVNQRDKLYLYLQNNEVSPEGFATLDSTIKILDETLIWHKEHKQTVVDHLQRLREAENSSGTMMISLSLLIICLSILKLH